MSNAYQRSRLHPHVEVSSNPFPTQTGRVHFRSLTREAPVSTDAARLIQEREGYAAHEHGFFNYLASAVPGQPGWFLTTWNCASHSKE